MIFVIIIFLTIKGFSMSNTIKYLESLGQNASIKQFDSLDEMINKMENKVGTIAKSNGSDNEEICMLFTHNDQVPALLAHNDQVPMLLAHNDQVPMLLAHNDQVPMLLAHNDQVPALFTHN
jgi:hypothetical protein